MPRRRGHPPRYLGRDDPSLSFAFLSFELSADLPLPKIFFQPPDRKVRVSGVSMTATGTSASPDSARLTSLDAYRGFVMFLMMAEVLQLLRRRSARCRTAASGDSCATTRRTSSGSAARCTT